MPRVVHPRGMCLIIAPTPPASRESLQRLPNGSFLGNAIYTVVGNEGLPRWPRASIGSMDRVVDLVVATTGPRRAHITTVPTAPFLARTDVGVAAAVVTVVAVALLLDGVKPVPHVTPDVIPAETKSI